MPIKKLQEEVENTLQMILSGVYMCAYLRGDLKQEVDMKVIFKSIKRINKFLDKAYELGRKEEREEREENKKIIENCDCGMEYDENRNPILHQCAYHKIEEEERLKKFYSQSDHSEGKK